MGQDHIKKEALFNEVKGSLFEYLVAKEIAKTGNTELDFQNSIDRNYLHVLSQQDRLVRQFYPEMLPFLAEVSKMTSLTITEYFNTDEKLSPRLMGKFSNSSIHQDLHEADLLLSVKDELVPISLKLNKKNAFVNTKSGGIKSFFSQYFSFLSLNIQEDFNRFVDLEFNRVSLELHAFHDLEYSGDYRSWTAAGLSELPGELDLESRQILKKYYARIAEKMHEILLHACQLDLPSFTQSLPPLMGFGHRDILQVICFHEFPSKIPTSIEIHSFSDLKHNLEKVEILPFNDIASVEVEMGLWILHIRVKPMNKFTTTAIKINCSVRFRSPT